MIGLARFIDEHGEAVNYDLLTRTAYQVNDVGGALSWGAFYAFIKNLGSDSALARDLGKSTGWETVLQTNTLLADIFDLLQVIHADLIHWMSHGKKKTNFKPYPRPGADKDKKRRLGSGAMPFDELREWIRRGNNGKR